MKDYERYGIEVGQEYIAVDGSKNILIVKDVLTYDDDGYVIVYDSEMKIDRKIDCLKLARIRYFLKQ